MLELIRYESVVAAYSIPLTVKVVKGQLDLLKYFKVKNILIQIPSFQPNLCEDIGVYAFKTFI
jgi:hypothetical protein